jgi:toxin-antitoxin system PIN domain toxin
MSIRLLDVNVLISLLDAAHVHHETVAKWFLSAPAHEGWATTAITENGFIRIVSQMSYPNMRLTPALAAESLAQLKNGFLNSYRFWNGEISLADSKFFDLNALTGAHQTTDAYLAGLAFHHRGRLATFDGGVPWRVVRGAGSELIEKIIA